MGRTSQQWEKFWKENKRNITDETSVIIEIMIEDMRKLEQMIKNLIEEGQEKK